MCCAFLECVFVTGTRAGALSTAAQHTLSVCAASTVVRVCPWVCPLQPQYVPAVTGDTLHAAGAQEWQAGCVLSPNLRELVAAQLQMVIAGWFVQLIAAPVAVPCCYHSAAVHTDEGHSCKQSCVLLAPAMACGVLLL